MTKYAKMLCDSDFENSMRTSIRTITVWLTSLISVYEIRWTLTNTDQYEDKITVDYSWSLMNYIATVLFMES